MTAPKQALYRLLAAVQPAPVRRRAAVYGCSSHVAPQIRRADIRLIRGEDALCPPFLRRPQRDFFGR
jgi:hypothetical protein